MSSPENGRDNQQERLVFAQMNRISNDYLVGFVEGEGMFYVGVVPSKETKTGWQVIYFFKVSQNPGGKVVLDTLKHRLGCGYVKANSQTDPGDKSLAYVVRDLPSLREKVIPFFEGKLYVKRKAFDAFKRVTEFVSAGKHFSYEGMKVILDLAYTMNTGKRRFSKEVILCAYTRESSQTIRQTTP